MKKIIKYSLDFTRKNTQAVLELPMSARIVDVDYQSDSDVENCFAWVLESVRDGDPFPKMDFIFQAVATDWVLEDEFFDKYIFLKTIKKWNSEWHIYYTYASRETINEELPTN